jgi:hypothetical protein
MKHKNQKETPLNERFYDLKEKIDSHNVSLVYSKIIEKLYFKSHVFGSTISIIYFFY